MQGDDHSSSDTKLDSGLACLVMLARLHERAADAKALQHRFGQHDKPFDTLTILRAAKALELKARAMEIDWPRLRDKVQLPAIARTTTAVSLSSRAWPMTSC
jgi:subfamily B ATP-binding cassette protein HlyB/CyaB